MLVATERAGIIPRPTSKRYLDFVRDPDSLLGSRTKMPFSWSPYDEYPLVEYHLSNGPIVDLALDPKLAGLKAEARISHGQQDHPAYHFLEHLMRHSKDVRSLDQKLEKSLLDCNGVTVPHRLSYLLQVSTPDAFILRERDSQFTSKMVYLLFSMMAGTDINENYIGRDRDRLIDESSTRRNDPLKRLYDRILPGVMLGGQYQVPPVEVEIAHTIEELLDLHYRIPFHALNLAFSGNPAEPFSGDTSGGLQRVARRVIEAAEETFGILPSNDDYIPANKKQNNFFGRSGTNKVTVFPATEMAGNLVGISLATLNTGNAKMDMSEKLFVKFLKNAFFQKLYDAGLLYGSYFSGGDYGTRGFETDFMGIITSRVNAAVEIAFQVKEGILSGDQNSDFWQNFQDAKECELRNYFQILNLDRVRLSRKLGLSTATNCEALYELIQNIDMSEAIHSGRRIDQAQRLGFIHYGQSKIDSLRNFEMVAEDQLVL